MTCLFWETNRKFAGIAFKISQSIKCFKRNKRKLVKDLFIKKKSTLVNYKFKLKMF